MAKSNKNGDKNVEDAEVPPDSDTEIEDEEVPLESSDKNVEDEKVPPDSEFEDEEVPLESSDKNIEDEQVPPENSSPEVKISKTEKKKTKSGVKRQESAGTSAGTSSKRNPSKGKEKRVGMRKSLRLQCSGRATDEMGNKKGSLRIREKSQETGSTSKSGRTPNTKRIGKKGNADCSSSGKAINESGKKKIETNAEKGKKKVDKSDGISGEDGNKVKGNAEEVVKTKTKTKTKSSRIEKKDGGCSSGKNSGSSYKLRKRKRFDDSPENGAGITSSKKPKTGEGSGIKKEPTSSKKDSSNRKSSAAGKN